MMCLSRCRQSQCRLSQCRLSRCLSPVITFAVNRIFLRFFRYSFILLVSITLLNFKKFCCQFFVVGQLKSKISFFSKFFIFKKYFWPCSPENWILYFIFIYAWNDSKFNGLSKNVEHYGPKVNIIFSGTILSTPAQKLEKS